MDDEIGVMLARIETTEAQQTETNDSSIQLDDEIRLMLARVDNVQAQVQAHIDELEASNNALRMRRCNRAQVQARIDELEASNSLL